MSEKSVAQKMLIKAGNKVLLVNAPRGYKTTLGVLPKGVKLLTAPTEPADVIQLFVSNRAELEAQLPKLVRALAPNGSLWVSYLKGTSKTKTDIHRDTIAAYGYTIGLEGVSLIAVDDDWSAMRFKVRG